ncbi:minor capsid protein [Sulfurovum sp. XTW-4]|uniref:Minor capsid protein n=1 Tax=Sulfurovum xiamenensis TaxID=3019066 RepID=A0ABT7QUC1_9BACT|nr:minor capsid protein [Sulfurovum xiamenensis]MDM5264688.1 minor capsid protein [Sulfurovum xiamenensis]
MTDIERYHLLLRYEALASQLKLDGLTSYERSILDTLDKVISAFVTSEDMTELQRRRLLTKLITEELDPVYKTLSDNLLAEMAIVAGISASYVSSLYLDTPIDKAMKFNAKTLIHGYELGDILKTNNSDHIKQFKRIIALGISEGKHSSVVARELRQSTDKRLSHIDKTIIQSAMAKAREDAKEDTFNELEKQDIIKGYEFVATLEVNTCAICRELDGKKWKRLKDIKPDQKPKIHFRCRCTLAPISKNVQQRAGQQYFTTEEGTKKNGSVFPNINYYEWLDLQPKEVQKIVKSNKHISLKEFNYLINL